jgi:hypothetical protein
MIKFNLELEILCQDNLDDEWVAEQYLLSDRFSTRNFQEEPGIVVLAASNIQEKIELEVS